MKKEMILSFAGFAAILKKYTLNMTIRGCNGDGSQEKIYDTLFGWAYTRTMCGVPPACIHRWVRGKDSVSRVIRRAAMAEPEIYSQQYSQIFKNLSEKNIFSSTSQLSKELMEVLKEDRLFKREDFCGGGGR